jgi:hypothetical protein
MTSFKDFVEQTGLMPKRLNEIRTATGKPATLQETPAIASALGIPLWKLIQLAEEGDQAGYDFHWS